jgi:hypothetical protein
VSNPPGWADQWGWGSPPPYSVLKPASGRIGLRLSGGITRRADVPGPVGRRTSACGRARRTGGE